MDKKNILIDKWLMAEGFLLLWKQYDATLE